MEGDPERGKKNVWPYGQSPKIGSPEPAHPDFYLYRRACLMVGGGALFAASKSCIPGLGT